MRHPESITLVRIENVSVDAEALFEYSVQHNNRVFEKGYRRTHEDALESAGDALIRMSILGVP